MPPPADSALLLRQVFLSADTVKTGGGAIDIFTEELGVPTSAWVAGQDSGEVSRGEPPFRRAIAA